MLDVHSLLQGQVCHVRCFPLVSNSALGELRPPSFRFAHALQYHRLSLPSNLPLHALYLVVLFCTALSQDAAKSGLVSRPADSPCQATSHQHQNRDP
jgi:hypothetical protein